jgi:nucleoside-diphosphate-sugar epimerase
MKIALTGAGGLTGGYVQEELARRGWIAVTLDADLTDAAVIDTEVGGATFDCVIHLAAEAFAAGPDWRRFYDVNLLGTLNLLAAVARHHPGSRCILASSAQVYRADASAALDESSELRPAGHYASSKLAMEIGARCFADRLELVIARPFNYTGRGQPLHYVIPKIVDHFRRGAASIELGNVDVRRDFGDVRAVAAAYAGLAAARAVPSVLNICTGSSSSIRDIVNVACRLTGREIEIVIDPDLVRPHDVQLLVGRNERLREALPDWRVRPLEDTIAWMLAG